MDVQPVFNLPTAQPQAADAVQTGRALGEQLSQMPEYRAFQEVQKTINNDAAIQRLSAQLRACQSALQWGRDVVQNAAKMERLEAELESLPLVQNYRQAENAARQIFLDVDELISCEAGVDFAANAKRSCCG